MFRYHRVLYRRLLRGQTVEELTRLREESAVYPTLMQLIDDELARREAEDVARWLAFETAFRSAARQPFMTQPSTSS